MMVSDGEAAAGSTGVSLGCASVVSAADSLEAWVRTHRIHTKV